MIVTVLAVVVVIGGIFLLASSGNDSAQAAGDTGPCKYTSTPDEPAPKGRKVGLPENPKQTPKSGEVKVLLDSSAGKIPLTLDRAKAPCTVQSIEHLVKKKFYDDTPCHRETTYAKPPLKVLQCGDPTGVGSGGPGYTIPDEKPVGLKTVPLPKSAPPGTPKSAVYSRGVLAMANAGAPNSGGSQFFIVYGKSELPPNYTIFGTVDPAGLSTVDKITRVGIVPGQDPNTGQPTPADGKPKKPVTIEKATIIE